MGGRKVWAADDVLAAADLNEYLGDQVVMVFANDTARSGAILAPVEGMLTYRQDDDVFEFWTGSVWRQIGSGTVRGITIFNSESEPTANAAGDLWFF
jgi:hypothetical protein